MTCLDVSLMFRNGFKTVLTFKTSGRCLDLPAVPKPYPNVLKLLVELILFSDKACSHAQTFRLTYWQGLASKVRQLLTTKKVSLVHNSYSDGAHSLITTTAFLMTRLTN
jgi:hypothetical protein